MDGRSIRPTIFDLYAEPELVLPMVLGNLMSPRLWRLAAKIGDLPDLAARVDAVQHLVNRHFTHLAPDDIARMDGMLRLDEVAARVGSDVVGQALDGIARTIDWRVARGTLSNEDSLLRMIDDGHFPNYVYGTIDELHAHRRLLGKRSARPIGITSCLDEAALFGSILGASLADDIEGIVLLGSAAHYTAFVWTGVPDGPDFAAWWFYGKQSLISADEYRRLIAEDYAGDAVLALNDRLPIRDLLVSRRGAWNWMTGSSALPEDERDRTIDALRHFFGDGMPELDSVAAQAHTTDQRYGYDALFEASVQAANAEEVQAVVCASTLPEAHEARLCSRDVSLGLEAFLPAAMRGRRVEAFLGSGSIDAALAGIATHSVFDDEDRVAMPEEVLAYGTAGARDRELFERAIGTLGAAPA